VTLNAIHHDQNPLESNSYRGGLRLSCVQEIRECGFVNTPSDFPDTLCGETERDSQTCGLKGEHLHTYEYVDWVT
jgi:hypothetical protein